MVDLNKERRVQAGPITLEVTLEWPLVVLTLENPEQAATIKLPMTSQEATKLGQYLITVGALSA